MGTKCYKFTITIGGVDFDNPKYEDELFEAGCDDGIICVNICLNARTIYIQFMREAENEEKAILSAIENIITAGAYVIAINED